MTDQELKQLYEKLYFHEIEVREKIHARLQLPLTLILAIIGAVVFLIQNAELGDNITGPARLPFIIFICGGCIGLFFATFFFVRALYDHAYHFLPNSVEIRNYRSTLEHTYAPYANRQALIENAMDEFIMTTYVEDAAFNTQVNDRRSAFIHLCNGAIIAAAVLLAAAFLMFSFGGLEKSKLDPNKSSARVVYTPRS